jgi:hypothetical protein
MSDQLQVLATFIPEEELTTIIAYKIAREPEPGNFPLGFTGPIFLDRPVCSSN